MPARPSAPWSPLSWRRGAAAALGAAIAGTALGAVVAATASGGLGTGNGLGGAFVAMLVGLAGTVLCARELRRFRRVG
ncbi:DUF6223 family protein [Kitasatospora sp. NPDC048407]|uniref:DUF6223 family protein n=1 Tax=Kitasatospora sp. NPDC048407 TaxID=3364051 RepID=UPI00371BDC44